MVYSRKKKKGDEVIKPVELLHDIRKSVSEILGRRFTRKMDHQIFQPDKKTLALWAADCAERVLPYFERVAPEMIDQGGQSKFISVRRYL